MHRSATKYNWTNKNGGKFFDQYFGLGNPSWLSLDLSEIPVWGRALRSLPLLCLLFSKLPIPMAVSLQICRLHQRACYWWAKFKLIYCLNQECGSGSWRRKRLVFCESGSGSTLMKEVGSRSALESECVEKELEAEAIFSKSGASRFSNWLQPLG